MSIPKEPRQIMINLMYLVLTAMLALNVTSEILNAFKTINDSIQKSNVLVESNNVNIYESLRLQAETKEGHDRVQPFYDKALIVKNKADSMYYYLDTIKNQIIREARGIGKDGHIVLESNIDIATRMFVEGNGKSEENGRDLKNRLSNFKTFLLSQVFPEKRDTLAVKMPLAIADPPKSETNPRGDWATGYFFHMPTIAAVTLFSKFQNDIRNSEAMVVQELMDEANVKVLKFDAIKAIAVPTTTYALAGQKVEAQILLGAYNKSINPSVSASQGHIVKSQDGVAYWENTASGIGVQTVRGQVDLTFNGEHKIQPYEFQYVVGSTGASLQLDKMNVFYIGIPNPVTVTAAGYTLEDVSLDIPGATVTRSDSLGIGHYNVMVTQAGALKASIKAKAQDGSTKEVGSMNIRTKFIPSPTATLAGKTTGGIRANEFRVQTGVVANMGDFVFNINTKVSSFDFSYQPNLGVFLGPFPVSGARFDQNTNVAQYMQRAAAGVHVFIDNVHCRLPDGRNVIINSLIFTIN
jgi:gliding motility-associated protein GldM